MAKVKDINDDDPKHYRLFPSWRIAVVALLTYGAFLMMFNFFTMNFSLNCMINSTYGVDDENVTYIPGRRYGHKVCGQALNSKNGSNAVLVDWGDRKANILSGSAWGSFFFVFITGVLCDRYGIKWFYVGALVIYAVTAVLVPIAALHSWIAVFALRFIQGTGVLIGWPALLVASTKWFPPKERGLLMSIVGSGFLLGCLLAMVVAGQFCQTGYWQGTFYVCAALNIVCAILWFFFYSNRLEDSRFMSEDEVVYLNRSLKNFSSKGKPKTPWKKILTSPCIYGIFGCFFADYYMFYYVGNYMPSFYKDILGFPDSLIGILSALPSLLQFVGRLLAGPISDRLERIMSKTASTKLNTAIAGYIPAVFIMLVAAFNCESRVGTVVCFGLAYFFYSFLIGGIFKSLSYVAPPFAGTLTGLGQTVMYLAAIIVPYISSEIIKQNSATAKEYHTAGFVAGAIGIVGTCSFVLFGSGELQEWAKPENLVYPSSDDPEKKGHPQEKAGSITKSGIDGPRRRTSSVNRPNIASIYSDKEKIYRF